MTKFVNSPALPTHEPLKAALFVTIAMAVMGLFDNFVVEIAKDAGLWQFHFVRVLMALPLVVLLARLSGRRIKPTRFGAVALRSLWVSLAMLCYFGALGFITVAEAVAGLFTAPFFVLLITRLWYREPVRGLNIIAAAIGFAGSMLVLRPDVGAATWHLALPVVGGFFYALCGLSTRRSCAGEGALTMLAGFLIVIGLLSAIGIVVTGILAPTAPAGPDGFLLRGWVTPTPLFFLLTFAQALTVIIGFGLITRAYIMAEATTVSVFEYVLLIFGAFWGWVLWGEMLDLWAYLGVALIVLSGVLLARQQRPSL